MKHISISGFKEVLQAEKNNDSIDFIKVCEPAEYKEKHICLIEFESVPVLQVKLDIVFFMPVSTLQAICIIGQQIRGDTNRVVFLNLNLQHASCFKV